MLQVAELTKELDDVKQTWLNPEMTQKIKEEIAVLQTRVETFSVRLQAKLMAFLFD